MGLRVSHFYLSEFAFADLLPKCCLPKFLPPPHFPQNLAKMLNIAIIYRSQKPGNTVVEVCMWPVNLTFSNYGTIITLLNRAFLGLLKRQSNSPDYHSHVLKCKYLDIILKIEFTYIFLIGSLLPYICAVENTGFLRSNMYVIM